jgi:hypothetical protein
VSSFDIRKVLIFRLLALSGLLAWQACLAGPVYKIVGPDGKVSFTDLPPAPSSAASNPAKAPSKAPAIAAAAAKVDKSPTAALAASYSKQIIVESAARFCIGQAPATTTAVLAARDAWLARNGKISEKRNLVMQATMSPEERNAFTTNMQRTHDVYLSKMRVATLAEKTRWCERVPVSFAAPELDMSGDAAMVRSIMDYQLPPD